MKRQAGWAFALAFVAAACGKGKNEDTGPEGCEQVPLGDYPELASTLEPPLTDYLATFLGIAGAWSASAECINVESGTALFDIQMPSTDSMQVVELVGLCGDDTVGVAGSGLLSVQANAVTATDLPVEALVKDGTSGGAAFLSGEAPDGTHLDVGMVEDGTLHGSSVRIDSIEEGTDSAVMNATECTYEEWTRLEQ